jgi:hypothetical protein
MFLAVSEDPSDVVDPQIAVVDQQTGTFVVRGTDQRGLLPGRYRVVVYHYDPRPNDRFKGAYGEQNSPILVDVRADSTDFNIDLPYSKPSPAGLQVQ